MGQKVSKKAQSQMSGRLDRTPELEPRFKSNKWVVGQWPGKQLSYRKRAEK